MAAKFKKTISVLEILIFIFAFFSPCFQAKAASVIPVIMISAWIKPTGSLASKVIIAKNNELRLVTDGSGNLLCQEHDGSGWNYSATSSEALQLGSWQHVACLVYKTVAGVKVYVNGRLSGNGAGYGSGPNNSNSHLLIGKDESGTYGDFQGYIDEPKIRNNFNNAVPGIEAWQDYNAGKAGLATNEGAAVAIGESPKWMTDGLVGHWKMDESSGTAVADASGNGNTGTLTNAQETGTSDASGGSTTTMVDTDGASLSTTDDAYNNMILRFTSACGSIASGTERAITDYTGASKTFTFAAVADNANSCAYEVRHQTGGKFGNGLMMAGDNDYATISDVGPYANFTYSAWSYNTGGSGDDSILGTNATLWNWLIADKSSGYFKGKTYNSTLGEGSIDLCTDVGSLKTNTWQHITVTMTATSATRGIYKMYIDGSLKSTYTDVPLPSAAIQRIGSGNGGNYFKGNLDDVRIYNRALAPDEVKQLSEYGPGPVGWWKMDENVSGASQTIKDYSGNGYNGTTSTTGADCTKQGKFGGGCDLDGANGEINVADTNGQFAFPYGDFSYGTWFYPRRYSGYNGILGNWDDASGGIYTWTLELNYNSPQLRANIVGTGGTASAIGTSNIPNFLNNWHHAMVVKTKTNLSIYVDGALYQSSSISDYSPYAIGDEKMSIGGIGWTGVWPFDGRVDDTRIYNYALSSKQVVETMNAGHPVGGSPVGSEVAYYKMDEGQGQAVYDSSPNHNNLQLGDTSGAESTDPTWTNSGKFGRALNFSKASLQFAKASDSPSLSITSDLTLSAWIKPTSNSAGTRYDIVEKGCNFISYNLSQYGSELRMYIGSNSNYKTTSGLGLQTGQLYHVAGVYNAAAQTVTLFVNGKDVGGSVTGTIPSSISDNAESLTVGDLCLNNYYDGLIDEVKVYSSALTPDQIALDMNQGKEMQLGGQSSATGATGQAAEYCVPGDATSCAGPVGEWKLDEKTGTAANDTSGNGHVGTLQGGATWGRGKYGSALLGDGTDDYVSIGQISQITALPITIEVWAKGNYGSNIWGNNDAVFTFSSDTWRTYRLYATGGLPNFQLFQTDSTDKQSNQFSEYLDNTWYHYTMVIPSGTNNPALWYINGKLYQSIAPDAGKGWYISSDNSFDILNSTNSFKGLADDVKIFNYARTPAQVAWDYNRGKPVGWWKMDEGEGDKAYDSSGSGNTGTLTSMDPPNDWKDGKFGKALDFDASDDRVVTGNIALVATNALTYNKVSWGGWVKPVGSAASKTLVHKNNEFRLTTDGSGNASCSIYSGSWQTAAVSSSTLPLNSWSHVMCKYDGTDIKVFVNGIEKGTQGETDSITSTNATAINIARDSGGSGYFQGYLDDVRVYNYALTSEQVNQVMNEGMAVRFGE